MRKEWSIGNQLTGSTPPLNVIGCDTMSNTKTIEVSAMYNCIKNIKEPKAVLIALSKLESEMGWHDSKEVRFWTYGVWLMKNGSPGWYDYYVALNNTIKIVKNGGVPFEIPDEPNGWIPPIPYLNGDKHD